MLDLRDPFAAIAEPPQQADPFASIADNAPAKQTVAPTSTDPSGRTPTGATGTRRHAQRRAALAGQPHHGRPAPCKDGQSPGKNMADTYARGVAENVVPLVSHLSSLLGGYSERELRRLRITQATRKGHVGFFHQAFDRAGSQ